MSGVLAGIATAVLFISFLAVVVWAWSRNRKEDFERAARLPLEDGEVGARDLDREQAS